MIGSGGDLSRALLLNASTMYFRRRGTEDSMNLYGMVFGRGGGGRLYPLFLVLLQPVVVTAECCLLAAVLGSLAKSWRLNAAAKGLRSEGLSDSMYLSAGVGFGNDGGSM